VFHNTLFDENASCHLALGAAYADCLEGGTDLSPEERARRGANESLTHVDFMVGSSEVDIDGETADGRRIPLMRKGRWAQPV
jgi:aminopeptidase